MVITQEAAQKIAETICIPLKNKWDEAEEALQKKATEITESKVPKEVAEVFKKHSEYIESRTSVYFEGEGLSYGSIGHITLTKRVPAISNKIDANKTEAKAILSLHHKKVDAKSNYKKKVAEIKNTLISLKSYKRIIENLPEVKDLLPKKTTTSLIIPVQSVKSDIKKLLAVQQ